MRYLFSLLTTTEDCDDTPCDPNADCTELAGPDNFVCTCRAPFTIGDGFTCSTYLQPCLSISAKYTLCPLSFMRHTCSVLHKLSMHNMRLYFFVFRTTSCGHGRRSSFQHCTAQRKAALLLGAGRTRLHLQSD